ncbi:hypothetical protein NVP1210O_19 [Vibrio phage 1.210.O._10N.222.52.C2]|nr:hypothetical protein NVP1210O_19 [Vibrio phage 1.210.O._10N.222.52.C2]
MIKLKDAYGDEATVSIELGDIMINDPHAEAFLKFNPAQARELAAALIECANKIQRKGGE